MLLHSPFKKTCRESNRFRRPPPVVSCPAIAFFPAVFHFRLSLSCTCSVFKIAAAASSRSNVPLNAENSSGGFPSVRTTDLTPCSISSRNSWLAQRNRLLLISCSPLAAYSSAAFRSSTGCSTPARDGSLRPSLCPLACPLPVISAVCDCASSCPASSTDILRLPFSELQRE